MLFEFQTEKTSSPSTPGSRMKVARGKHGSENLLNNAFLPREEEKKSKAKPKGSSL